MKKLRNEAVKFLQKYKMDFADIDMRKNVDTFLKNMKKGLAGKKNSLEMIPTYLDTQNQILPNERVIVIDAGGTNVRVATIYFNKDNQPVIDNFEKHAMPGVNKPVTKKEFFDIHAGYLKKAVSQSGKIGFCFSYPTEIFPNKDGKVIRIAKEVKAKEVEGQMIGENLNIALMNKGIKSKKHIVLLNDTVATLLAGKGSTNRIFDSYIGFILGTGTNCCYSEQNKNITKNPSLDPKKSQIINIESGQFCHCQRGMIDEMFDKTTINPGYAWFEKMISGAYLGPLCLKTIEVACGDSLFSKKAVSRLKTVRELDTKSVNGFLNYSYSDNNILGAKLQDLNDDIIKMYYLLDRLVERAAKLSAINLSSAAIKCGKGKNPARPICIVAEGTTFYNLRGLKERVTYYLKNYLENTHEIYTEIMNVENSTLIGAAIAGLTN